MVRFGDSDAFIINDLDLKTKIIDYIFSIIDLSKYRYNMLENQQQLNFLKINEHYVSPNFKGYNYFLVFYKFNNISNCVAIDKKNLSYHKSTTDVKKIYMFKIKVMASQSVFRGTLLDAKLIKNIMLVKDCYNLMGNNITEMEMNEKMIYIDTVIENQFQKDYCANFKLKINKLYKYNMLSEIVNTIIPKCEFEISGLIFYPNKSGVSYIYNDKKQEKPYNTTEIITNESYNMIHEIKEFLISRTYPYESCNKKKVLTIEPTNIPDVFNVYEVTDKTGITHTSDKTGIAHTSDKTGIAHTSDKLGIAHIPNMKTSIFCREQIKEKTKCLCVFNKNFNKWIPLELAK